MNQVLKGVKESNMVQVLSGIKDGPSEISVIPPGWRFKPWGPEAIMVFWPNNMGQTLVKSLELDKFIEAGLLYQLSRDLLGQDEKLQQSLSSWSKLPPVNSEVIALGEFDVIGKVKIKAYGDHVCIAEDEDGKEIAFDYTEDTFRPIPEDGKEYIFDIDKDVFRIQSISE